MHHTFVPCWLSRCRSPSSTERLISFSLSTLATSVKPVKLITVHLCRWGAARQDRCAERPSSNRETWRRGTCELNSVKNPCSCQCNYLDAFHLPLNAYHLRPHVLTQVSCLPPPPLCLMPHTLTHALTHAPCLMPFTSCLMSHAFHLLPILHALHLPHHAFYLMSHVFHFLPHAFQILPFISSLMPNLSLMPLLMPHAFHFLPPASCLLPWLMPYTFHLATHLMFSAFYASHIRWSQENSDWM